MVTGTTQSLKKWWGGGLMSTSYKHVTRQNSIGLTSTAFLCSRQTKPGVRLCHEPTPITWLRTSIITNSLRSIQHARKKNSHATSHFYNAQTQKVGTNSNNMKNIIQSLSHTFQSKSTIENHNFHSVVHPNLPEATVHANCAHRMQPAWN